VEKEVDFPVIKRLLSRKDISGIRGYSLFFMHF